ncbi:MULTISPECIES: hypothetical protein [Dyadobacter]|uniref:Outer membrane protein beta-barrel domain-containing protein n=1 Tax=Dyadobacter chenhuakuii TaxID=2909339 RepID=A0A9X1QBB6_9BACT|nr:MULTISPECIES: hypothetical protein [Dyadobacter]MCF2494754.1 hypothetical protein [Dyadobacter chenhuakuii]MCF2497909.1 hypothetical protein [Dyadobacter chenhuakuii]MCF2519187.1 hypothetical protein [Dyadobacter sp. CY351]USJ31925.1 hypothetical protein NFI80_04135 [Dyadobacter chenhuakuii]
MNKYFLLIVLTILSGQSFGQNANAIFVSYSRSKPEPVYNRNVDGGGGYKAIASNTFGIRYFIKSSKIITLETGIDYSSFNFKVDYVGMPNVVIPDIIESLKLISVPVYAHLTFLKYIFVNGGLLLDAQINPKDIAIDRQTGIGLGLGVGLKYDYKHIAIFINPFVERHGLFSLDNQESGVRQSIMNPGGRIGIGYSF